MAYFPIVRRNSHPQEPSDLRRLPDFYMQDFTVLGFRVNDCDRAVRILDRHAFEVRHREKRTEVDVATAACMQAVMQLLTDNGLDCEIADVAEGMYQG